MKLKVLDTSAMSSRLRSAAIDVAARRLLVTNFHGTKQEQDLSEPANCSGIGRIRHFQRRATQAQWPVNPLPIDPASRALGLQSADLIRAQVFQNAVCNWRCWYCFVDFSLLAASRKRSEWVTASDLITRYLAQDDPPPMIDLTGGQPDLTPEWVPWMMTELRDRGLDQRVYLWSDDNLSSDYFWRYLTDADHELIASYPMYGRVCCFKGIDAESFAFNTLAAPELFPEQFNLMRRLLGLGIDIYAYVTFTTQSDRDIRGRTRAFVDRLQAVHPNLPLRTIPLEIQIFTPVRDRMDQEKQSAITHQYAVASAWMRELEDRFTKAERTRNITDVPLAGRERVHA